MHISLLIQTRGRFHWRKQYRCRNRVLAGSNGLKLKVVSYKHAVLAFGLDYCDVFISCLDTCSDGTHSLCRGSIGEQVMQCLISQNLFQ